MSIEFGIDESIAYREWDPEGDWLTWSTLRRYLSYVTGFSLARVETLFCNDTEVIDAFDGRGDPYWNRSDSIYRSELPLAELKTLLIVADARRRLARSGSP